MFVRLAAILTFQITGSGFFFLAQLSAITCPAHAILRFVHALERRQRRTVDYRAVTACTCRYRDMLGQATWYGRLPTLVQSSKCRFGHGAPSID